MFDIFDLMNPKKELNISLLSGEKKQTLTLILQAPRPVPEDERAAIDLDAFNKKDSEHVTKEKLDTLKKLNAQNIPAFYLVGAKIDGEEVTPDHLSTIKAMIQFNQWIPDLGKGLSDAVADFLLEMGLMPKNNVEAQSSTQADTQNPGS